MKGYVPADGTGSNGVLVVLEAGGEEEAEKGRPTVGKAGLYLWSQLARVGLERDEFRVHNVLSCRPPGNKLSGESYEDLAIATCAPLLDATIADMQERRKRNGKTFVILALGKIAFKRIMGLNSKSSIWAKDYYNYPFWSERYSAWVFAAPHPSYLMRGNHSEVPILQFAANRAVEVATEGLILDTHRYLLDPTPAQFAQWIVDYKAAYATDPSNTFLSYDIETPYKRGKGEDVLDAVEDDDDYTILRISFCYRPNEGVSIPFSPEYLHLVEDLMAHEGTKLGWNSQVYDLPRVRNQMDVNGDQIDGMLAWHVLNSAMKKSLGFVTPYYAQTTSMWKHMNESEPAFYNAKDADMALRCWLGIRKDLIKNNLWGVFNRHIIELSRVLNYMSKKGLRRDEAMRTEVEGKLDVLLTAVDKEIADAIPPEAKLLKRFKKTPKSTEGLVQVESTGVVKRCSVCGVGNPLKPHFKVFKKKENPCAGASVVLAEERIQVWARELEFKISKTSLERYQAAKGHKPVFARNIHHERKVTFDGNAMKTLLTRYPGDPLYTNIGKQRGLTKLLSTYVGRTQPDGRVRGGMRLGKDGLGHCEFNFNPETLRLAAPFWHQLPRPGKPDEPKSWIRNMIIAGPGNILLARDFSGIEAVLVGYEMRSARYIRLAKMDVHSFFTAYSLYHQDPGGRLSANDLPLLEWDDERLATRLAEIKAEFKVQRNELYKHLTHAINFGQGAQGAQEKIYKETGVLQPVKVISTVMGIYKNDLFPEVPKWHHDVRLQADKDRYLRNAFGYMLRFNHVFRNVWECGQWVQKLGDEAEMALAFKPQSNAAGIIKESMLRLYFKRFEEAGQWLRLQVHDENFLECPEGIVEDVDRVLKEEMEWPIPELGLPASWGMGECLSIGTEAKMGKRWGEMK